jgi:hypothetical protein
MTASKKKSTKTKVKKTVTKKAKAKKMKTAPAPKAIRSAPTPSAIRAILKTAATLDKENAALTKKVTLLEDSLHSVVDEVEDLRETLMTLMEDLIKGGATGPADRPVVMTTDILQMVDVPLD